MSRRAPFLFAAIVFAACTGGGGSPSAATKRIGSQGGELTHSQGASLRVPSGVLTSELTFSVEPAPAGTPLPNGIAVGEPFVFGPEGSTFSSPLTVVLPVDLLKMPAGRSITDVVVMTAQQAGDPYTVLQTRITDATHVEALTSHFSIFVPVILSSTSQGDGGANDGGPFDGGADGGADGGFDGGADGGGSCVGACSSGNDGGADCECSETCGQVTREILCSGTGPYGCACVENGRQVKFVTLTYCPGPGSLATECGFGTNDGGIDGGSFDGGADGGTSDAGTPDAGIDAGRPDAGGYDAGYDGGGYDAGYDAGNDAGYDAGNDAGYDAGGYDGGYDAGSDAGYDAGYDAGGYDGGYDAGSDAGYDAGRPDSGANDGG